MNLEAILKRLSTCFLKLDTGFEYGPQGRLLFRNIENLWFHHCVTTSRYNVFLSRSDEFSKTIQDLKNAKIDALPFGLAAFENSKIAWNHSLLNSGSKGIPHKIAKVVTLNDGLSTKDLFHKKQRERKAWWRKLSHQPSRFVLSEAKKSKNNEVIDIKAQYPFGDIVVETITYQRDVRKFQLQDRTCKEDSNDVGMVEHVASLDWGCLALLCDSCKENDSIGLQLQPKISPYKAICKVSLESNVTDSIEEDLNQLMLYINNLLRTNGLSTISTSEEDIHVNPHVPFVIAVDETSLKNGIVKVTSQITTLAESVHITQLVNHIASHCT